jgi:hypothetical protein
MIFAIIDKEPVQKLSELFKSSLLIRLDSKKNRLAYICQPRYTTQFCRGEIYVFITKNISFHHRKKRGYCICFRT